MADVLIYSWIAFALVITVHRRLRGERVATRAPGTWLGIAIQAAGFSLMWMLRSSAFLGLSVPRFAAGSVLTVVEGTIGALSIALAVAAVWFLGRNWSVAAEVVPGHRLVREGPYRFIRHPIYTAMLGMLVATGFSLGSPVGLAVGVAVFTCGTRVRVHFEERLLRSHFGAEFDQYASAVPAFVPSFRKSLPPGTPS